MGRIQTSVPESTLTWLLQVSRAVCLFVVTLCHTLPALGQTTADTPQGLFAELRHLGETSPSVRVVGGPLRPELRALAARIAACDAALPEVRAALSKGIRHDDCYYEVLDTALHLNNTEKGTEALFWIALVSPKNESETSLLSRRRITCTIPDVVYDELVTGLPNKAYYPEILARCELLPLQKRLEPIVKQFLAEVAALCKEPPGKFSYSAQCRVTSPLERFLSAFHAMGEGAIPLIKNACKNVSDPCPNLWGVLARAAAGDTGVADEVQNIINSNIAMDIRILAVMCYGHALKVGSVPYLKTVAENDKRTGWAEGNGTAIYPLRDEVLRVLSEYDRDFVQSFLRAHPPERLGED
jgi:hypothetical protein